MKNYDVGSEALLTPIITLLLLLLLLLQYYYYYYYKIFGPHAETAAAKPSGSLWDDNVIVIA